MQNKSVQGTCIVLSKPTSAAGLWLSCLAVGEVQTELIPGCAHWSCWIKWFRLCPPRGLSNWQMKGTVRSVKCSHRAASRSTKEWQGYLAFVRPVLTRNSYWVTMSIIS